MQLTRTEYLTLASQIGNLARTQMVGMQPLYGLLHILGASVVEGSEGEGEDPESKGRGDQVRALLAALEQVAQTASALCNEWRPPVDPENPPPDREWGGGPMDQVSNPDLPTVPPHLAVKFPMGWPGGQVVEAVEQTPPAPAVQDAPPTE